MIKALIMPSQHFPNHFFLFFLICILFSSRITAQSTTLELKDLNNITRLSSPQISPDGTAALFITTKRDYENNRFLSELQLMDLKSGKQEKLSEDRGLGQPSWSPDGTQIAFLARGNHGRQIYLRPTKGGKSQSITNSPTGIQRYSWSPDGTRIAYIAREETPVKTGIDRFNDAFEVGNNDYLRKSAPVRSLLWIIDLTTKESRQIGPKDITLATGLATSSLSWSANGKAIAFSVFPSPYSGDTDLSKIYTLEIASGSYKGVTEHVKKESNAKFSPNGKQIAFSYPRDGIPSNVSEIYLQHLHSGEAASLSRKLDRHISDYLWLANGSMLLKARDGLKTSVWLSKNKKDFTKLKLGDIIDVGSWSTNNKGALLFVGTKTHHPGELYYLANPESKPKRLTNFHKEIAEKKQGKREGISWESTKGLHPNGVLTFPPNFNPNTKHPLILFIHGGPTASSTLSFNLQAQVMASKGWIVFQPNYRGSNNLGNTFQSAIANDAGEGPGQDVIAGVNVLKQKPYIDSTRIAVSGWSYGGWMTAWMIGRYPDVWTAAVAGAAPIDFTDMYSLNDLNRMRRHAITDSPYKGDNLMKALEQSPLMHLSKIRTPTLIMSKTGDARVTITGSYKLYGALRDNNVPVQFIAYPGPGHFPSDPVRSLDVYTRWIGWLEKYLAKP